MNRRRYPTLFQPVRTYSPDDGTMPARGSLASWVSSATPTSAEQLARMREEAWHGQGVAIFDLSEANLHALVAAGLSLETLGTIIGAANKLYGMPAVRTEGTPRVSKGAAR